MGAGGDIRVARPVLRVGRSDAVVVAGRFVWTETGQPARVQSYTGLLVRQEGQLRIRLDDEDAALERPGVAAEPLQE